MEWTLFWTIVAQLLVGSVVLVVLTLAGSLIAFLLGYRPGAKAASKIDDSPSRRG